MAKQPKKKRMGFIHKIESVLTVSRFHFHSVAPYLLVLQLAIYLCFVSATLARAEENQRVLILQSYHIGFPWSDSVAEGIRSVLGKEKNVEIFFEYMDSKRHINKPYLEKLLQLYKDKYEDLSLDVIICSDDDALNFLLKNRDNLFPGVPIVFCGINNFTDSRIAGHTNITGAVENPDVLGTLQIALRLHPGTRQVAVVYDQTKSGLANAARLRKIAPDLEKQVEFKHLTNMTISELRDALRALPSETVVLHLYFARDKDGVALSLRETSELVNNNSAGPVYTCWDVSMAYPGSCGGKMVSGYAQGEIAARMVLQILHGESANNIDIIRKSPNVYMFDHAQMNRFGLSKKDLPNDSIIVNEPFSFYETYKGRIWITLGAFVFLLFLIVFFSMNIIRRKQAEQDLLKERTLLKTIIDRIPVMLTHYNPDAKMIYLNKEFEKIVGWKTEEVQDIDMMEKVYPDPDYRQQAMEYMQKASTEWREFRVQSKSGKIIDSEWSNICMEDGTQIGIGIDVSERKKAEEVLRESEEKYSKLFHSNPQWLHISTLEDGRYVEVNEATKEITGYERDELVGRTSKELGLWADYEERSRLVKVAKEQGGFREQEVAFIKKNGEPVSLLWSTAIIEIMGTAYFINSVADITDIKQATAALRESEEKYRTVLESNPDPVVVYDIEGSVTYLNPAFTRVFGWSFEEQIGKKIDNFVPEENWPETRMMINKVTVLGESFSGLETRRYTKEGNILDISISGSCYRDQEGNIAASVINLRDITEQKSLEGQLQKARKMEAMGLMAGGVAHDLNNILSGIVSYPELLLMDIPEDSPMWKPIKTIQESGMRAADVVEDLLTIARGVASGKEILNLNTMVEEYLDSAEHQKLERIHPLTAFKTELDSGLLNITGSASHVKKILMNLVTNASEAIEGSGVVTISTTNRYVDEPLKGYEDVRIGEYAVLSVSDDGSGISAEDLERIFEPFYTKKMMGRSGTGLGLAVVWNCMQDHNGYINVKSSHKGTVFELYFPVTREEVAAEGEEVPLEDYLGHGEKILVVDDEERQREIASGILTRLGYNSETVSSGEEGIEYVKTNPVDLILLDMVMPKGINGRKTYEEIIKIRPGQKAIIASGYAKTKEVDKAQELGAGKYIKKPYTLAKVGLAVKGELEK